MNTRDTQKLQKIKVALIGGSGVGKTTQIAKLIETFPAGSLKLSISCTTREKRDTETDGKDYHFISREKFQKNIELGLFAEWSEHHGDFYGTLKSECDITNHSVIFDIEVDGGVALKKTCPDLITIFLDPPSIGELKRRLTSRKDMSIEKAEKRIQRFVDYECKFSDRFDYCITAETINGTFAQIAGIIFQKMGGTMIAIDGTAASGKGTLASKTANVCGGIHVNSGLLYRYITKQMMLQYGLEYSKKHFDYANCLKHEKSFQAEEVTERIAEYAHRADVRETVFDLLMKTVYGSGKTFFVCEGRDMTTFVFPYAKYKFFIDADLETRAKRRQYELTGSEDNWEFMYNKLANRDASDYGRDLNPLYFDEAAGVVKIDNSGTLENSIQTIMNIVGSEIFPKSELQSNDEDDDDWAEREAHSIKASGFTER